MMFKPRLLDLFCGVGGWSKAFADRGWDCVGVDSGDFGSIYPGTFIREDVRNLDPAWVDSFDAVVASPPCEDFARAWLPWLRGDHVPDALSLGLLKWSVSLCDRPGRLVECSNFASRHLPGAVRVESYSLWGDVPLLLPFLPRGKTRKSGLRPDLRAEIPGELARAVACWFESGTRLKYA